MITLREPQASLQESRSHYIAHCHEKYNEPFFIPNTFLLHKHVLINGLPLIVLTPTIQVLREQSESLLAFQTGRPTNQSIKEAPKLFSKSRN